ncbi:MAG: hypothetical protein JWQ62_1915 [Lacunisphaera sp.]|nr:hypothetical protein [Lacunisphaera sp.]
MLLRAPAFSQAILTATLMVVGERRRREADWFTAGVDAEFFRAVQFKFATQPKPNQSWRGASPGEATKQPSWLDRRGALRAPRDESPETTPSRLKKTAGV